MMNAVIANREEIAVGDPVWVIDPILIRENGAISAEVLEIRRVLGEQTYLIETETGERKLMGVNQSSQMEPFTK
ncbi:MAG TPA: hypothetical protein VGK56_03175 [Anaerolineales bacterium]